MMGGGAAGLGALAMLPSVSAFQINSDNPLSFNNPKQSGTEFEVGPSGDITSMGSFATGSPVTFKDDIKEEGGPTIYDSSKNQVGDGTTQANHQSLSTDRIGNAQFPDAVVYRDGSDAVAVDTSDASVIARNDATTDAYTVIQSALDTIGADSHLRIMDGRYSTNSADHSDILIHVTNDNVTISGEGAATVLTIEDNATPDSDGVRIVHAGGQPGGASTAVADDFTIRDIKIDGNQQNNGGVGDGNTIANATDGHNIQVQGDDYLVHNVRSINGTGDGVEITSRADPSVTRWGVISSSIFRDNYEQNIHVHGAWDFSIVGCICDGEYNNDNLNLYAQDTDTKRGVIVGNEFRNSVQAGAFLSNKGGTGDLAQEILFANNFVHGNNIGIDIQGGDGARAEDIAIIGNYIANNTADGIQSNDGDVPGLVIKDNIIEKNGRDGIRFADAVSNGAITEAVISGNVVRKNDEKGLFANCSDGIDYLEIVDNSFIKNNRASTTSTGGPRLNAQGATYRFIQIKDNTVFSDGSPDHWKAIFLYEASASTYSAISVKDNLVYGDQGAAITDQWGIAHVDNQGQYEALSSPPSAVLPGFVYLDDGTNRADSNVGYRKYDGSAWVDIGG